MSKLLTIWNYIRRHKYMITVLIFIVVIGFLDENSLIQRVKHRSEISALNRMLVSNTTRISVYVPSRALHQPRRSALPHLDGR